MFSTSEDCKVADVAEAKTGTPFPGSFCHLRKTDCPKIVGVGARAKRLLGVKNVDGVHQCHLAYCKTVCNTLLRHSTALAAPLCRCFSLFTAVLHLCGGVGHQCLVTCCVVAQQEDMANKCASARHVH